MEAQTNSTVRIEWVDWMKAIGIYLIVLGHFFPVGDKYIYAFNVPLFFIISGFLCKKELVTKVFYEKLLYNLVIPLLIIVSINFVYDCVFALIKGEFELRDIIKWAIKLCLGFHGALANCWFVYTLIVLKVIFQFLPNKLFYAFTFLSILLSYIYNNSSIDLFTSSNSIINVFTAFPFFTFGVYMSKYKPALNSLGVKVLLFGGTVALALLVTSATLNDYVWMYLGKYGRYILLFIAGGIAGTYLVFAFSKLLGKAPYFVKKISYGTIIILGFHSVLIKVCRHFFDSSLLDFLFAAIITILFVPIIVIAERYFPIILGKYRLKG